MDTKSATNSPNTGWNKPFTYSSASTGILRECLLDIEGAGRRMEGELPVDFSGMESVAYDERSENQPCSSSFHVRTMAPHSCTFSEFSVDESLQPSFLHYYYPTENHFTNALECYNEQLQHSDGETNSAKRWECKGEIQASFQLCILCKDIGKPKSYKEKYFLNVNEIKQNRTILCKGCLGYLMKNNFNKMNDT